MKSLKKFLLCYELPDDPGNERAVEFYSVEAARACAAEIRALPWAVEPPVFTLIDSNDQEVAL